MVASDLRALIVEKKVKEHDAAQITAVKKGLRRATLAGDWAGLLGARRGKTAAAFPSPCSTKRSTLRRTYTDCDRWVGALDAWRTYVASGALEDEGMVLDSLVTDAWQQRTSALHSVASARNAVVRCRRLRCSCGRKFDVR